MSSSAFPSLSHTFRAFPLPTIAEDTLHYNLYLTSSSTYSVALALLITQYVESLLLRPWLWNKDGWELKAADGRAGPSKLEGRMRVGDAVDDEWLVVWLLREISRKWPELVISIRDNDGEFLLIEAANELPSWISPENAENRLWLQDAHLHLIPLSIRSSASTMPRQMPDDEEGGRQYDPEAWISEEDAVRAVRTGKYKADEKMEQAVWERIACYPDALKTHRHWTKAYLPERIARALSVSPELVQRAVEGFYVRDPSQLRAASRMTHFPPSPSVLTSVLMTRAAYAQLQGQVFQPPRVFGPEWSVRQGAELDDERRWRDLGVKIATGFDIMYREGGKKGRIGEVDASADTFKSDPAYRNYIANLKSAGFFGDELEGSASWKMKEVGAAKGWKAVRSADTTSQRPSFAFQVDVAVESASASPFSAGQASSSSLEDCVSWLEVSPDELDGMMARTSGRNGPPANGTSEEKQPAELGHEQGEALQDLAKKVEQFVGGQGDVEGARFEDELSDDGMDDDGSSGEEEGGAPAQSGLSKAEQDERMRNLVPALPDREWGRKPGDESAATRIDKRTGPSRPKITKPASADSVAMSMRPPIFAKQSFDGVVSDSDEDSEDEILPPPGTLGRKIAEMKWLERAPKIEEIDDTPDQKPKFGLGDDIDEQMRRRVWGEDDEREKDGMMDIDPDMGEEEEEFLKFSRDALGISDDVWEGILSSRLERGAFVPKPVPKSLEDAKVETAPTKSTRGIANPATAARFPEVEPAESPEAGGVNMDLDSFEKVMAAMDTELAKATGKTPCAPPAPPVNGKPTSNPLPKLPTEADLDDMDEDDLTAMDRELRAALKGAGIDEDDEDMGELDVDEAKVLEGEDRREYSMMRDFLESYRSQAGGSGVVGNLFGRLGKQE